MDEERAPLLDKRDAGAHGDAALQAASRVSVPVPVAAGTAGKLQLQAARVASSGAHAAAAAPTRVYCERYWVVAAFSALAFQQARAPPACTHCRMPAHARLS